MSELAVKAVASTKQQAQGHTISSAYHKQIHIDNSSALLPEQIERQGEGETGKGQSQCERIRVKRIAKTISPAHIQEIQLSKQTSSLQENKEEQSNDQGQKQQLVLPKQSADSDYGVEDKFRFPYLNHYIENHSDQYLRTLQVIEKVKDAQAGVSTYVNCDVRYFNWALFVREVGCFDVVVVDPPWRIKGAQQNDTQFMFSNCKFSLEYNTMSNADIGRIPLELLSVKGFCFMWILNSQLDASLQIMQKWGYTLFDELVWLKLKDQKISLTHGYYFMHSYEICLVGYKDQSQCQQHQSSLHQSNNGGQGSQNQSNNGGQGSQNQSKNEGQGSQNQSKNGGQGSQNQSNNFSHISQNQNNNVSQRSQNQNNNFSHIKQNQSKNVVSVNQLKKAQNKETDLKNVFQDNISDKKEQIQNIKNNQKKEKFVQHINERQQNNSKNQILQKIKALLKTQKIKRNISSNVIFSQVRQKSQKPQDLYAIIDIMFKGQRKIQIFARNNNVRFGFFSIGNELGQSYDKWRLTLTCDNCSQPLLFGKPRFKSKTISNFDLCLKCIQQKQQQQKAQQKTIQVQSEKTNEVLQLNNSQVVLTKTHSQMSKYRSNFFELKNNVDENVRHEYMSCNNCHNEPIWGVRFQCLTCADYDLCQNCFDANLTNNFHPLQHDFNFVQVPIFGHGFPVHDWKCVACYANPIVGVAFSCTVCVKWHLCQKCFFEGRGDKVKRHSSDHQMEAVLVAKPDNRKAYECFGCRSNVDSQCYMCINCFNFFFCKHCYDNKHKFKSLFANSHKHYHEFYKIF